MDEKKKLIKCFEEIAKRGAKRAEKLNINESDVPDMINKLRGCKSKSV